jgi:hypothetical protein
MQISEVISSKMPEPGGFSDLEDITTDPNLIEKYTELAMSSPLASEARELSRDSSTGAQEKLYEIGRAQEVYNTLKKNASDALAAAKSTGFLYRGTKQKVPDLFLGTPWLQRKPRDTKASDQKKIDELLTQAGYQALRSNSVFASGALAQAAVYGKVYMVFPFNEAKITWNTKYNDFWSDIIDNRQLDTVLSGKSAYINDAYDIRNQFRNISGYLNQMRNLVIKFARGITDATDNKNINSIYDELSNIIEKYFQYDSVNLPIITKRAKSVFSVFSKLIAVLEKMQNDLIAYTEKYKDKKTQKNFQKIGVDLHDQLVQFGKELENFLKNVEAPRTPRAIASAAGFVQGDLPEAIKSRNEVYVSGPYYAVSKNSSLGKYLEKIIKLS